MVTVLDELGSIEHFRVWAYYANRLLEENFNEEFTKKLVDVLIMFASVDVYRLCLACQYSFLQLLPTILRMYAY